MKIILVQLDAGEDWRYEDLIYWLEKAPSGDLVVFPECYPFWREKGITHKTAMSRLEATAQACMVRSFIAGGYVADEGIDGSRILRNRTYLVHHGFVVDYYDKQIAFQGENLSPNNIVKLFSWGNQRCLPLICADADDGPKSSFMDRLVTRARALGVGPQVPIIVSSYGAMLTEPYWKDSLHHLADTCEAPVLICGIAGKSSSTFIYDIKDGGDGAKRHYGGGGGGSGLFIPGQQESRQYEPPCYIVVNLDNLETRKKSFSDVPSRGRSS